MTTAAEEAESPRSMSTEGDERKPFWLAKNKAGPWRLHATEAVNCRWVPGLTYTGAYEWMEEPRLCEKSVMCRRCFPEAKDKPASQEAEGSTEDSTSSSSD